jgi:hypothetical protein
MDPFIRGLYSSRSRTSPPSDTKFSEFTIIPNPDQGSGCCVFRGGLWLNPVLG